MSFNWEFFNCSLLENTKKSICWLLSLSIKEQREILTFLRKNFRSYICGRPTHSKYRPHHIFSQAKISQLQGGSLVFISLNLQGIKTSKPSNCNWDKEGFWHSVRVQPGQSSNNSWKLMGYPRTATSSWTSKQPLTFSTKEPDLGLLCHRGQHHRVIRWDAQIHGSKPSFSVALGTCVCPTASCELDTMMGSVDGNYFCGAALHYNKDQWCFEHKL